MAFVKRKQAFIDIKDLKPGDIIGFYRAGGSYFHCGIYDGKGYVIHRGAEPGSGSEAAIDTNSSFAMFGKESNKAEIRKDDLRLVAGSSPVYRINMFDKVYTPCPESEIVRWAEEQIGKKGYNEFFKNCQHFCTKARYDKSFNMQVQEHIILKSEQPYEMNRTLVNVVNLPELPRQPVSYTTAEKNVFSFEGYVRYMSRHMDLDKLSEKGLCALASSSVAIQPILAALKNNTHTLFTETGNGFQRATIKFDQSENSTTPLCIRGEINITALNSDMGLLLAAESSALRPLSMELKCTIGNSTVSNHLNVVRLEYTNFNSNPFCTATTSNCSIIALTERDGTYEVSQWPSFDRQNSTTNSSSQWRANCSSVAENIGHVEIQEVVDDEDMRNRNFNLYTFGMAGGLVSAATIFDTVIYSCFSWMLYLMKCSLLIFLLFGLVALLEYIANFKVTRSTVIILFRILLIIVSVVLFISMTFVMYQE